jgi:hypothetical protein
MRCLLSAARSAASHPVKPSGSLLPSPSRAGASRRQNGSPGREAGVCLCGDQPEMQNENREFPMISNIMKTTHETVKNTISSIR